MRVGDLVRRRSTGAIDIIIEIVIELRSSDDKDVPWIRTAGSKYPTCASNYEVISESR